MLYRTIGKSNLEVSVIGFGSLAIVGDHYWGPQDKREAISALRTANDLGINFFDTAEAYGNGYSEQLIAEALGNVRKEIIIASKVVPDHFQPELLVKACENSLRNLKTDWIDLYQLHWPNHDLPVIDAIRTLELLKKQGKIREYGISNYGPIDMAEYFEVEGQTIVSNQVAYSLLFRAAEYEIQPVCKENNISIIPYSPLMQGLLTGKFFSADEVPSERAQTRHFSQERPFVRHDEEGLEEFTFRIIRGIKEIGEENGLSMIHLSLGWLLAQEMVVSVIPGARNSQQSRENASAGEIVLSDDILEQLNKITTPLKEKMGKNADMWLDGSRIR